MLAVPMSPAAERSHLAGGHGGCRLPPCSPVLAWLRRGTARRLDFGAGCFNEHRMRQQNVPGAAGEQRVPAPGEAVLGPALEACPCMEGAGGIWIPELGLGPSHPSRGKERVPGVPGDPRGSSGVQPGLGYNCSVLHPCVCLFRRDFLNKAGAQGAWGGAPGASRSPGAGAVPQSGCVGGEHHRPREPGVTPPHWGPPGMGAPLQAPLVPVPALGSAHVPAAIVLRSPRGSSTQSDGGPRARPTSAACEQLRRRCRRLPGWCWGWGARMSLPPLQAARRAEAKPAASFGVLIPARGPGQRRIHRPARRPGAGLQPPRETQEPRWPLAAAPRRPRRPGARPSLAAGGCSRSPRVPWRRSGALPPRADGGR